MNWKQHHLRRDHSKSPAVLQPLIQLQTACMCWSVICLAAGRVVLSFHLSPLLSCLGIEIVLVPQPCKRCLFSDICDCCFFFFWPGCGLFVLAKMVTLQQKLFVLGSIFSVWARSHSATHASERVGKKSNGIIPGTEASVHWIILPHVPW